MHEEVDEIVCMQGVYIVATMQHVYLHSVAAEEP